MRFSRFLSILFWKSNILFEFFTLNFFLPCSFFSYGGKKSYIMLINIPLLILWPFCPSQLWSIFKQEHDEEKQMTKDEDIFHERAKERGFLYSYQHSIYVTLLFKWKNNGYMQVYIYHVETYSVKQPHIPTSKVWLKAWLLLLYSHLC